MCPLSHPLVSRLMNTMCTTVRARQPGIRVIVPWHTCRWPQDSSYPSDQVWGQGYRLNRDLNHCHYCRESQKVDSKENKKHMLNSPGETSLLKSKDRNFQRSQNDKRCEDGIAIVGKLGFVSPWHYGCVNTEMMINGMWPHMHPHVQTRRVTVRWV